MSLRRRQQVFTVTAALGGLLLLAWAARRAGISDIVDGIRRVGWGLIPILGLGGLRFAVRAEAWRLCAPIDRRLTWRQAFTAFLAGDAVGNVTPLGLLASEPTKVFLTRHHLATRESISSLAIDNLLYSASIVTMVGGSGVVLLLRVPLPDEWRKWGTVALAILLIAAIVFARLLRGSSGMGALIPVRWRERAAALRGSVLEFSSGHPLRLWRVYALDLVFHALAVLEAFLALRWLLGAASPSPLQALLFEALNRVITVLFKFVPFRAGVDEVSSGGLAHLLGMDPATGVALAIVRKVRNLFWAGIGMTIIAVHPGQAAPATDHL
ncbi:MAG TPA: lysylphosphatidylglycerol synthase transmembrane domain-containing protein [Vicinamibacterales bacterium]|nr:lysylphosphatidylglycerol synthase transmembrane domain-containing protein [Vicinamibacterales bacterium]